MVEKDKIVVAFTTCPTPESAESIATQLVTAGLAACVNRVSGVLSTYRWEGQVRSDGETLLIIKTTAERFDALKTQLVSLHPYQVPELIALPVCAGSENYLDWVRHSVK